MLVDLEMAGSAGVDEERRARARMWSLLSKQLIGGLGKPRDAQLRALWKRYDTDRNGLLSKAALGRMLIEYAAARADEIAVDEIPNLEAMLAEVRLTLLFSDLLLPLQRL